MMDWWTILFSVAVPILIFVVALFVFAGMLPASRPDDKDTPQA